LFVSASFLVTLGNYPSNRYGCNFHRHWQTNILWLTRQLYLSSFQTNILKNILFTVSYSPIRFGLTIALVGVSFLVILRNVFCFSVDLQLSLEGAKLMMDNIPSHTNLKQIRSIVIHSFKVMVQILYYEIYSLYPSPNNNLVIIRPIRLFVRITNTSGCSYLYLILSSSSASPYARCFLSSFSYLRITDSTFLIILRLNISLYHPSS